MAPVHFGSVGPVKRLLEGEEIKGLASPKLVSSI